MSTHPTTAPPRALLPTLVLLTSITALVSSLGAPLVPTVAEAYDVRLTTAQWSLTAALLAGAVSTPVVGRFASGRLRRPTILVGLGVVTLGTLVSALSATLGASDGAFAALVAGRALQGVGMALLPLAIAVARDVLAGERQERAIALLSVTTVAGAGLGYPVTAVVAELGGLGAAYALGGVLSGVTLLLAWRHLPGSATVAPARVDWAGAVLLSAAMLAVLLAVSEGEVWGWASVRTLGLGGAGLLALVVWVRWTLRSATPLVDLRLAVRPGVAAPNLVAAVAGLGMYALLTLVVVLVRTDEPGFGLGRSVVVAGLILVPYSLMSVLGNQLALLVRARLGSRWLLPTGCSMFLAATLSLGLFHDHLWQASLAMTLGGAGSGFTFSSLAVLMVPHLPAAETGSAVAFNQVLRYLGFTVGSALSVALMAAYGGGADGFRAALLTLASVWVVAGVGAVLLDRAAAPPTRDPAQISP
ncbi:MFS transporter [Nocardioides dokdonensis]|uniref:MFS transporter n=1 Tax=Nocardioides dokdonensis TaxID=450734 RepID=UPI00147181DC|nr:MFS transporter [Nocardioides dokdonensis]